MTPVPRGIWFRLRYVNFDASYSANLSTWSQNPWSTKVLCESLRQCVCCMHGCVCLDTVQCPWADSAVSYWRDCLVHCMLGCACLNTVKDPSAESTVSFWRACIVLCVVCLDVTVCLNTVKDPSAQAMVSHGRALDWLLCCIPGCVWLNSVFSSWISPVSFVIAT